MTTTQVRGITGLLDGILSPTRPRASEHRENRPPKRTQNNPPHPQSPPIAVRRGRPPGNSRVVSPKEKVTVWITSSLIGSYRDWTWQERCQLSHLIERALADYHEQHRQESAGK